jgi:hypothetical protein
VAERLDVIKLSKAAEFAGEGISETLSYYAFPQKHGRRIRANKPLERITIIPPRMRVRRLCGALAGGRAEEKPARGIKKVTYI